MKSFDEVKLAELYNKGESLIKIAKALEISDGTVRRYARDHPDICQKSVRDAAKERKSYNAKLLVKMWNADIPTKKIAEDLGVCRSTVRYYAQKHPEKCKARAKIREKKYATEDIVTLRSEGKTAREIADQLGITEGTVNGQINYYPDLFSKVYSCYDQEKLIKLWKAGVAANIIAKELGISRETVTSFVSAHREICDKRKTKYTVSKLYNMYKANTSIKEIAKQVGISEETVEYFIQSYQEEHLEEVSEYEAEIMRLWDENRKNTYKVIAKKLGINPSEVLSVLRKHNQSRVKRRNAYDPNDIVKLWNKKLTTAKIAEKLGIPKTTVAKFASKHRDLCPRRD